MSTKRLYHYDPYLTEFTCTVTKCTGPVNLKDYSFPVYMIEVDRTAFYPMSGGQPCDKGTLAGIDVFDIVESEDTESIMHITNSSIAEGQNIIGKVDFDRRFDHMQQHTGQHILSAAFVHLFDIATKGFHLGEEYVTIDLDSSEITEDQCAAAERMACDVAFHNHQILISFHDSEEAANLPSRKQVTVTTGDIRIVEVEGFDKCMCCGTHVDSTGEVGIIKILKTEKIRGMTRVEFICGRRALKDYATKNMVLSELSNMLSTHPSDISHSITKMQNQYKDMKKQIDTLTSELLVYQADEMYTKATIEPFSKVRMVTKIFNGVGFDSLKMTASKVCQKMNVVTLFASKSDNNVQFLFQRSENVDLDVNKLLKSVLDVVDGKGGGSAMLAQGGAKDVVSLESIMSITSKKVEAELSLQTPLLS